eukprot:TRINITY_DN9707_c0_g1_i1.p1 TRINITY_DN9707_c0_g1~~TRINITY_DN9707_c0_g1_i1.p1  ORF type:complete len:483 (-),score=97.81 TRINITY_DN9707_c0_g1_i1:481-1854(-)
MWCTGLRGISQFPPFLHFIHPKAMGYEVNFDAIAKNLGFSNAGEAFCVLAQAVSKKKDYLPPVTGSLRIIVNEVLHSPVPTGPYFVEIFVGDQKEVLQTKECPVIAPIDPSEEGAVAEIVRSTSVPRNVAVLALRRSSEEISASDLTLNSVDLSGEANQLERNSSNPKWHELLKFKSVTLDDVLTIQLKVIVSDNDGSCRDYHVDLNIDGEDFTSICEHSEGKRCRKIGSVVGETRITVKDVVQHPNFLLTLTQPQKSMVERYSCPPLVDSLGENPTLLSISIDASHFPLMWPQPARSICETQVFPRHVMMMTRGTQGDVQPFVALARGLAETFGWLVTIVTELAFRDFIKSNSNVRNGAIRFRPSGGDTGMVISSGISKWAIQLQSGFAQATMLALAEAEFFPSEPLLYYWAQTMKPNLIIYSFTLCSLAILIGESIGIPILGFFPFSFNSFESQK